MTTKKNKNTVSITTTFSNGLSAFAICLCARFNELITVCNSKEQKRSQIGPPSAVAVLLLIYSIHIHLLLWEPGGPAKNPQED